MDWEPGKFLCRLWNFKEVAERSENVRATKPHVSVVGDNSKECTKLFHVFGRLYCGNDFDFLWIWFDTTRSEPVSKEVSFFGDPFSFARVDSKTFFSKLDV